MTGNIRKLGVAALAALALTGTGCGQMGSLNDVLGGVLNPGASTAGSEVQGEVRSVDTRSQTIQVYTTDGRSGSVRYDNNTRVIYQQREYQVSALEAGDRVTLRIRQDQSGNAYTDQVYVTQSVQEVGGGTVGSTGGTAYPGSGVQTLQGNVNRVDYERGMFEIRTGNNAYTWVSLPYNPRTNDVNRLRQLRGGDYVRVEGRYLGQDRFELERFVS